MAVGWVLRCWNNNATVSGGSCTGTPARPDARLLRRPHRGTRKQPKKELTKQARSPRGTFSAGFSHSPIGRPILALLKRADLINRFGRDLWLILERPHSLLAWVIGYVDLDLADVVAVVQFRKLMAEAERILERTRLT